LTGEAVKVTDPPEQIVEVEADIETEGTEEGFTVIMYVEEVAGLTPVENIIQYTEDPFVRLVVVNEVPPATSLPLTNH